LSCINNTMDKSNNPSAPAENPSNGLFNFPDRVPDVTPLFHPESYTVRHRSLFSHHSRTRSALSESSTNSSFPPGSDNRSVTPSTPSAMVSLSATNFSYPTVFDSRPVAPSVPSGTASPTRMIEDEMGELSFSDSNSQEPDTQTPVVSCLTTPACSECDFVPSRALSVNPFARIFDEETQAVESPAKSRRLEGSVGVSPSNFAVPAEPRRLRRFSRLNRATVSACTLPTPELPLLTSSSSDLSSHVTLDGLTIPVVPGIHGHSNKHIRISLETTSDFLSGKIPLPPGYKLLIWDARFIYEYEGGHIRGARRFEVTNIRGQLEEIVRAARANNEKYYVLCYCQFSQSRAPKLRDILFSAEYDIMLAERTGVQLSTEEDSRFRIFIVEGGYDAFYAKYPDLCEPRGYTRELDDLEARGKYRPEYEEDIKGSCASRMLQPSPASLLRRSQSSMGFLRRGRRADRHYSGISDDEGDDDDRPANPLGGVRTLSFEDLM